jgi:hypothetical protein
MNKGRCVGRQHFARLRGGRMGGGHLWSYRGGEDEYIGEQRRSHGRVCIGGVG